MLKQFSLMSPEDKKKLILKRLEDGDKRSYNEIAADLELQLWSEQFSKPIKQRKSLVEV